VTASKGAALEEPYQVAKQQPAWALSKMASLLSGFLPKVPIPSPAGKDPAHVPPEIARQAAIQDAAGAGYGGNHSLL
jgi:hypothetical protein